MMVELNLLPDIKKEFLRAQRTRNLVISGAIMTSIIAGGFVVILASTVYVGQQAIKKKLSDDITTSQRNLEAKPEINKYLAIQGQLTAIDKVSSSRSQYARLLDFLPLLNPAPPSNVSLTNAMLTKADNSLVMDGEASTFEAVNNFRYTLENAKLQYKVGGQPTETNLFSDVKIDRPAIATNEGGKTRASFKLTLTFAPEAFDMATTDIKISVPKLTTSNSDQNAPKESLFNGGTTGEPKNGN